MPDLDGLPTTAVGGLRKRKKTAQSSPSRRAPALLISRVTELWLADLRAMNASVKSIEDRSGNLRRFCWWLEHEAKREPTLDCVDAVTVREFLAYCRAPRAEGRFGSSHPNAKRAARPSTIATVYRDLKTFARFCEGEGFLTDPLKNLKCPRVPEDQLEPLTLQEVQALLDAAKTGSCPERDRALMLMLLDSGMRLGELLGLTVEDVAADASQVTLVGKGNKRRVAFLGKAARKALRNYLLRWRGDAEPADPLFVSVGGNRPGEVLRGDGVRRILRRCAKVAGIKRAVGAHAFRRTFAINFLRSGGSLLHLQDLLGHADTAVLRRYAKLCAQDLEASHRQHSPADRLGLR